MYAFEIAIGTKIAISIEIECKIDNDMCRVLIVTSYTSKM